MAGILRAARFEVCKNCGAHGHIVFSDGSKGSEVISEESALTQLDQAKKDGKVIDIEVSVLKGQILNSNLSSKVIQIMLGAMVSSAASAYKKKPSQRCASILDKIHSN